MEENNEQPTAWHGRLKNPKLVFAWEVIKVVTIALAIIIPVRFFLIQPFYVKGASMEPTFNEYEYLIINEIGYRFHPPLRGDVVVLRNPQRPSQFFIKRVIGLPGETLEVKNQHIYINGELLDESGYLDPSVETWGNKKVTLKDNEYYVLGDNRNASLDSRMFGAVPDDIIIGKAWLRAWPVTKLAHFSEVSYN
jgi:signal peptidase I